MDEDLEGAPMEPTGHSRARAPAAGGLLPERAHRPALAQRRGRA